MEAALILITVSNILILLAVLQSINVCRCYSYVKILYIQFLCRALNGGRAVAEVGSCPPLAVYVCHAAHPWLLDFACKR